MPPAAVSRKFHAGYSEASEQRTIGAYWAQSAEQVLQYLQATTSGLSNAAAAERLRIVGPNQLHEERAPSRTTVLARQLASPLLLLLLFAAGISLLTGDQAVVL